MIWAGQGTLNDFFIEADVTLTGNDKIGGIGFGWVDAWNGWLLLANATTGTERYELYEVTGDSGSGHTFALRASGGTVSSAGGTFSLSAEVRSGAITEAHRTTSVSFGVAKHTRTRVSVLSRAKCSRTVSFPL